MGYFVAFGNEEVYQIMDDDKFAFAGYYYSEYDKWDIVFGREAGDSTYEVLDYEDLESYAKSKGKKLRQLVDYEGEDGTDYGDDNPYYVLEVE